MMNDSMVQCLECGRQEQVSFAHCLRRGWPKCCGYTMRLMEHPDVSEVMADVLQQGGKRRRWWQRGER